MNSFEHSQAVNSNVKGTRRRPTASAKDDTRKNSTHRARDKHAETTRLRSTENVLLAAVLALGL